jgi:type IV pilus assembly protein PilA
MLEFDTLSGTHLIKGEAKSDRLSERVLILFRLLNSRKTQPAEGFTLIELIMVIVIIGALAVIALPSFLHQTSKARQAEAKTYVGAMNRAQQLNYLQNRRFSRDLVELELSISTDTDNFSYSITNLEGQQPTDPNDLSYKLAIVNWALPKDVTTVRSYLGVVDVISTSSGVGSVASVMCQKKHGGLPNQTGYTSGQNYTVVTITGDSAQVPLCADPFQTFEN